MAGSFWLEDYGGMDFARLAATLHLKMMAHLAKDCDKKQHG
jgi:hypothetical protein